MDPGLAGALFGFVAAFAAEPVKNIAKDCFDIRLLRRALYSAPLETYNKAYCYQNAELRQRYYTRLDFAHIKTASDILETFVLQNKQVFDYARNQKPMLFYRLEEASRISTAYSEQEYYQKNESSHSLDPCDLHAKIEAYAESITSSYEKLFNGKTFHQRLIRDLSKGLACERFLKNRVLLAPTKDYRDAAV